MKGMIFKKAFLLGGIFLLATCMSVQLSWSCDDDDKWDCDHHDKWDCHKHGKPCHPPRIQKVFLDYKTNQNTLIKFTIWGKNFDNGATPAVTLGGEFGLSVLEYFDDHIVATLPTSEEEVFEFGDYRLVVSTCHDSTCKDKYCKDHGPNCKCKYCKDHCSRCKDKYCRDKYCKDNEYKCRCKDRYSLTIADPSGQPITIGQKIVPTDGKISTNEKDIEGTAYCDEVNDKGYMVTGGGFEVSKSVNVMVSMPVRSDEFGYGWYVFGTVNNLSEVPLRLKIHGVCAKLK